MSCEGGVPASSINDIEAQLSANRRYWAGWSGSDPDADLPIYRTDIPNSVLNGVLRLRNRGVDEAVAEARGKLDGTMFSWWVGDDSDPGTAEQLIANGAEQTASYAIMAMMTADLPAYVLAPADLTVQRVTGDEAMRAYVHAYAEPFGYPEDALEFVIERELEYAARDRSVVRLAGLVDGKTVATAVVSLGEVAGLYYVATDADYRRRGIATALSAEAIRIARDAGAGIVTLQTSEDGAGVYRALGFQEVGSYRFFGFAADLGPRA